MSMGNIKPVVNDKKTTLVHDFIVGHEYEVVVRAVGPDGTEQAMESAARNTIVIQGKLAVPNTPITFTTDGYLNAIVLDWVNPADHDFAKMEIWRSAIDNVSTAAKIAEVKGISYIDAIGVPNTTRYYWIRAINTSGVASDYFPRTSSGVVGLSLGVTVTDIDDFSVTATKLFTNTIILSSDSWTNNSPGAGSIAWSAHFLTYGGAYYLVAAGDTNKKYTYWDVGNTGGSGTVADPYLTTYSSADAYTHADNRFAIATNESGAHQLVWNASANMVIGSAFILDAAIIEAKIGNLAVTTGKINSLAVTTAKINNLAVTNAKINTMTASKLTAGTIDASVITVTNLNATNITAGTLTSRTVQTAASGQRIVMSQANNNIILYVGGGAGAAVVTIDDNIVGSLPGIALEDGTNAIYLTPTGIYIAKNSATGLADASLHIHDIYGSVNTSIEVMRSSTETFTVSSDGHVMIGDDLSVKGDIGMVASKTVDGVDISAFKSAYDIHTHTFASLTSKPTTLAGYGITDAAPLSHVGAGGTGLGVHAEVTTSWPGFMGGSDKIKLNGIAIGANVTGANAPQAHAASHENLGGDKVNVGGLSGLLADDQTPAVHNASKITTGELLTARGGTNQNSWTQQRVVVVAVGGTTLESSPITTTELGYLNNLTENVQARFNTLGTIATKATGTTETFSVTGIQFVFVDGIYQGH